MLNLFKKSEVKEEVIQNADGTIFKVPYTTILDVQPHSNAERLEVATVYGFQVIVSKGRYKVGDYAIYIPIDSIISPEMDAILFPPDAKVRPHHFRIRQIKLRGLASQGMLIDPQEIKSLLPISNILIEQDLKTILNVKKYQPPEKRVGTPKNPKGRLKNDENPYFYKYNGLTNIKWTPFMFKDKDVVIQEKLHGTNARAGVLPYAANTPWKMIKRLFGFAPKYEKCYGSNNVEISNKNTYTGFYGEDVYGKTFNSINVFSRLKPNEIVFGEIVGPGIQKGYSYGLKEHKFVLFDVKNIAEDGTQFWLTPNEVEEFAQERGFEMVPILYKGPYDKDIAYNLTKGPSLYNDKSEKVREGIVIKAMDIYDVDGNKQALKMISEEYLSDATNTDEH